MSENVYDVVRTDADSRCELVHETKGRCAQSCRGEIHHIKYRSRGGDDTKENLMVVCNKHHRQIHEGTLRGPSFDDKWRTTFHMPQEQGKWYVWSQVKDEWEAEAVACDQGYQESMKDASDSIWDACAWIASMEKKSLYQLLDYESIAEYARSVGVNEKTAQAQARIGSWLTSLDPDVQKEIVGTLAFWEARDLLGTFRKMEEPKLLEVVDEIKAAKDGGMPATEVVKTVKDGEDEEMVGWEVTLKVPKVDVTLGVDARSEDQAISKVKRMVGSTLDYRDVTAREV